MLATISRASRIIGRNHRKRWILVFSLALIVSIFEVLGAILVYLLVGLIGDPETTVELPVIGRIQGTEGENDTTFLLTIIVIMAAFFVLRSILQVINVYVQKRVAQNAGARLSERLVDGYLRMPYVEHLSRTSSELIRNGHVAVQQIVNQVLMPTVRVVTETMMTLGLLMALLAIAPGATALAALVIGLAAVPLQLVIQPKLKRLGRERHQLGGEAYGLLQQALHGVRDIKLLACEATFTRTYSKRRYRIARLDYLRATLSELPHTLIEFSLVIFILLYFAIVLLQESDVQSALPILGLFAYAGLRIQPSLQRIISGLNELKHAEAPLEDIHEDLAAIKRLGSTETRPTQAFLPFESSVVIQGVSFRYPESAGPALTDVSLKITKGQSVGVCGPTGGGKSTLVDLITGLITPTNGEILIDGQRLAGRERDWQKTLGVVPQMVFLIDDTLRSNITFGVPVDEVDQTALAEAISLSQLDGFVARLPDGLETRVGERGVRLSGGERQRIAIARALFRRPEVLVFDEGTSALDVRTESFLMDSIDRLKGDRTVILVAHRLATVQSCDQVVFVDSGRIAGIGSFTDLRENNDRFRSLVLAS